MEKEISEHYYEGRCGELDGDLNVYVYTQDDKGAYTVRGRSIGQTPTETSFYDSDKRKKVKRKMDDSECWQVGSKIDMNDMSGQAFLSNLIADTPLLPEYMDKARGYHPFDFKRTNGTSDATEALDVYRGMPFKMGKGSDYYIGSARDIGNIGAGYVAAANGLPYLISRIGFDMYQFKSNFQIEGISTINAEQFGYHWGVIMNSDAARKKSLGRSFDQLLNYMKINP